MSDAIETPPRAPFLDGGARRPNAFEAAGRHSQRVRFFRRAIVMTCVSVVALIGFVLVFDPMERLKLGFSVGRVGLQGSKITMEKPRLTGYRNDGAPYEISAAAVVQDAAKPKLFELQAPEAKLGGAGGETTKITAASGLYDSGPDRLDLHGPIRVDNPGRYQMEMKSAEVDLRAGVVVARAPVTARLPNGTIEADSATFSEPDRTATFEGRVRSLMTPPADDPAAEPSAPAEAARPQ